MGVSAYIILAQTPQGGDIGQLLAWVGAIIVVVVIGTLVLLAIRRRMVEQRTEDPGGFSTMEDLRAMVASGEMSKEEYEQVRKAMITRIKASQTLQTGGDGVSEDGRPARET